MQHRGERSLASKQRYEAKRFILDTAYDDDVLSERDNILTPEQVLDHVIQVFPNTEVQLSIVPCYGEDGVVLVDSRGSGALQLK